MKRKVVDFHAHAFHDKIAEKAAMNLNQYYGISLAGNGKFDVLLDSMKENEIDKLVIHATATKAEQVTVINDYVSSLLAEGIIGFGTLHQDFLDYEAELERIKTLGLSGIKFHPIFQGFAIDSPKMMPIYKKIAELRLPVLMHMGDKVSDGATPKRLGAVLDAVPDLVVVAAHLGGSGDCLGGEAGWREVEQYLCGRSHVYYDTSSSVRFIEPEKATEMIHRLGTDRVVFGTDYPLSLHRQELEVFDKLLLTEAEQEAILWKNAYRLLGLS